MLLKYPNWCCRCSYFLDCNIILFFSQQFCDLPLRIATTVQNGLELKKKRRTKKTKNKMNKSEWTQKRNSNRNRMYELYIMNWKYSIILLKGARTYQRRMPARNHQICKNKLCCFFTQNCSVKIDDTYKKGPMRRSIANTNRFKATDYINTTELHIYDVQVSNYAELDLLLTYRGIKMICVLS